ncbi:MAG: 3-hydroxy-3-methylglutaryl CoA synthase [Deltaproteobacteria bacterium]|nr:3-hydroxy-3-methylglutaryl CoA synthase [Deltaproteobacteria bacterium]MBW2051490.1 3-hydroxy-3-methylglutaryl CoA synthase [Deltaproteobacteria bacterium]MBW2142135.1 3-hydroxy-3-methylglutaryl CoA synthase [Deltaproteobacteria bacterium]MBW2323733.1 3-hydroxy-3-methylglutaryl CoA synthase [Deltaproteobacteria bacterium]
MDKIGIGLCGSYIPIYRLDRKTVAEIWGRGSIGGERSVANNDEDSATMAVEASANCLKGSARDEIEGLYFATTSPVYQEKLNATLVATALDLKREITTLDFGNSLRAGTGALKAAFDSVKSGSMKNVLVAAADCRVGYPRSDQEQAFGDGAAAVVVSQENILATFEGSYSISNEMYDVWRNPEDTYVRTWESRFILGEGYTNHMVEVVKGILKKYNLEPKDITKAVMPAPNARTYKGLIQKLGFDAETQAQDPLLSSVGHCGAAHSLLMLVSALEDSAPGDTLLLANYADGADAMLFKVTDEIKKEKRYRRLKDYLDQTMMLTSYARFLSYKGLVEAVPGEPFRLIPSATVTWRDRNSVIRCHGSKCLECGTLSFPIQRICPNCDSKDNFEETAISDFEGSVFTFTLDNLAGRSDDPVVVQTIADMGEEKVRFYGMMTDCVPSEVKIGMPVGFTFRKIYDGSGMHNYFWKLRPLHTGGNE